MQLLMGCCGLIPDAGPYTKEEATQLVSKAATFAALLLCDFFKADKAKIIQRADPRHVDDYQKYHSASWDSSLQPFLEAVRWNASTDQRVSAGILIKIEYMYLYQ